MTSNVFMMSLNNKRNHVLFLLFVIKYHSKLTKFMNLGRKSLVILSLNASPNNELKFLALAL